MGEYSSLYEKIRKKNLGESAPASSKSSSGSSGGTYSSAYEKIKNAHVMRADVDPTITVDDSFISKFFDDYNRFVSSASESYKGIGYGNAGKLYDDYGQQGEDLRKRGDAIKRYLWANRAAFGDEYDSIADSIEQMMAGQRSIVDSYRATANNMNLFDSEDAYNQYVQRQQDYQDKWGHYVDAPDYADYSARGAAIKNPTMSEAERGITIFGKQIGGADVGNIVTYSRDNYQQIGMGEANGSSVVGKSLYHYMTDEEVGIYNYLLAKNGSESAQAYLDELEEDLNFRMGTAQAGTILSMDNPVVRAAAIAATSVGSGVDQWGSGIRQMLSNEKLPTSSAQFGSSVIAENLDGVGRYAYLAGNTIGNMAPSILLSSLTAGLGASASVAQGVGNFALGASAAGNAYGQALADGYSTEQARTYGVFVGASEALLQHLLGGIGSLGGVTSGKIMSKVAAIDNSLLRIAAKVGVSIGSEITEEELQSFLEPAFRSILFGEDYDAPTIEELLETAVVTAMSTGLLEGPSNIGGDIANSRYYKSNYGDVAQELVAEGLESPDGSVSKTLAQKYQEILNGNGSLNGHQLGRMVEANEQQFTADDMTAMESAAAQRLTELGETGDVSAIGKALAKQAAGEKLTRAEKSAIQSSKYGQRVASEMNPGNIETGGFTSDWAQQIGTKRINADAYNLQALADEMAGVKPTDAVPAAAGQETATSVGDSSPKPVMPVTERFAASGEGKTSIANMGKVQIASTEGGKMTLKTEGGQTVKAEDVSFRSEDEALVYSAVLDMGVSPVVAQSIVDNFDGTNGRLYAEDVKLAYQYGKMNFPKSYLEKLDIQPHQAEHAYNLGRSDAKAEVFAPKTKRTVKGKRGTVTFETTVDESTLKPIQRESLNGIKAIADLSGLNVHVFMSDRDNGFRYTMPDGAVTTANGWYIPGTNEIWVDLNAGKTGEGTMLYTFAHEISHYIKDWSPAKWRVLADFLLEQYGEDVPLDALLQRQMDKISKRDPSLKGNALMDAAYEELVSDAMSEMLVDGEVAQKLAELKHKDRTLWEKIKEAIRDLLERWGLIRKEYEGKTPDAGEAQFLRGMDDAFKKLQKIYTEAFAEASENFAAAAEEVLQSRAKPVSDSEIVTDGAVVVDGNGNKFSIRSMKADIAEGKMFDDLMKYCGWSQARVNELRRQLTDLVAYMEPHRDILDMNESYGREGRKFSPYKPNSDPLYQISMDFSTLCSKRLLTQYVIENLQLRENRPMSAEEQMAIRDMLIEYRQVEKGLQVACAMCYVEAARLKSPKQMQRWLDDPAPLLRDYFGKANKAFNDSVKEAQADFKESRGYARNAPKKEMSAADVRELNKIGPRMRAQYQLSEEEMQIVERAKSLPNSTYLTAGNLASLSETDPVIYRAYTSFVRTATRSKSLETDEPYYYGDSARDNGNGIIVSDSFIEAVNRENGMRFSSWSDWRIQHLLDYITAVIDNSVRGAAMHGYTKFAEEVRVLGKTGMMFNLSGVAGTQTGLNPDGSLNFSPTESIDINDAIELREEFPETAGLQCIGVSDDHVFALLRSDIIDYVIPYHVSGLNAGLRRMADIYGWKDYTSTQHAVIDSSVKHNGQEHWHEEPVFSEFFVGYDTGMTGEEAMQESARRYVEMCRERGLTPKFEKFAKEPGYWKLLVDRKMINQKTGELIRQKPVTPTFDFDAIKAVVDRHVANYDSGLEARALSHIVKNWDSIPGRIRELKKRGAKKSKAQQALDTLHNEMMAARPTGVKRSDRDQEAVEFSDVSTKFSVRDEAPPKKVGVAYKVFLAKDGQLYPPMVANPGGEGTPVGVWLNADIGKAGPPSKSGRPQVQGGGKGTNSGKISLAFRPGWHLGDIPLAKQFARLNPETGKKELFPANFVWAECEYAMDVDYQEEAMSYGYTENGKFRHAYAGLPKLPADGYYRYRTNPNPDTVPWVITGAMRVKRILTDAETDAICRENGVEPMARQGGPINLAAFGLSAGEVKTAGDMKYSERGFGEQVDEVLAGTFGRGNAVYVGKTPDILQQVGLNGKLPMLTTAKHILNATKPKDSWHHQHGLTETQVKSLPEKIAAPVMVMDSLTGSNSVVVVTDMVDPDGSPVVVTIKADGRGMYNNVEIDTNFVTSYYGRDAFDGFIADNVAAGNILYVNRKKATALAAESNTSWFEQLKSYDFDTIVRKTRANVKMSDRDYMAAVESGDMETAQRMVDEAARAAGYITEAYHGTVADFTVFDKGMQGKGIDQYGAGFYFANKRETAAGYGKNIKATYLNIKNPIRIRRTRDGGDLYDVKITQKQAYEILKRHPLMYTEESPLGDFYPEFWDVGAKDWMIRGLAKQYTTIGLLDGDPMMFRRFPNELHDAIRDVIGYDGVQVYFEDEDKFSVGDPDFFYIAWFDNQMKSSEPVVRDDAGEVIPLSERFNPERNDIRYSERDYQLDGVSFELIREYKAKAPTFYSHMAKVVGDVKQTKLGAASVVPMLRGKGVKAEEIKWSGIEAWLEGKKSVTKVELQEFIAGSMLQIEESHNDNSAAERLSDHLYELTGETLEDWYGDIEDADYRDFAETLGNYVDGGVLRQSDADALLDEFTEIERTGRVRWSQYKLDGGSNYREILFRLPGATYSNNAMATHWGEDTEGVLAHARIQDMPTEDGRMLFVEEIQSDWHNAGHNRGYVTEADAAQAHSEMVAAYKEMDALLLEISKINARMDEAEVAYEATMAGRMGTPEDEANIREIQRPFIEERRPLRERYNELDNKYYTLKRRLDIAVPDAPFRETYHEYVMKRLIRMAAEGGYDSIGWTTADIQSDRWSDTYAEGYRIEYDQDIPKFMTKYGKKWGAKVSRVQVGENDGDGGLAERLASYDPYDEVDIRWMAYVYLTESDPSFEDRETSVEVDASNPADLVVTIMDMDTLESFELTSSALARIKANSSEGGYTVWSMTIPDAMKRSVLYDGQPLYSERDIDSVSPRDLLAGAMESIAQTDTERKKIAEYRQKVQLLNEQEAKLAEIRKELAQLSFSKGKRDAAKIRKLQDEATKTANRISTADKILLRMEASGPLMAVVEREKAKAYARASQKWADRMEKSRTGRDSAALRHKIKAFKGKLERSLLKPTDTQYIPIDLIRAMVDVCNLIDVDTELYHADGSVNKAQQKRNLTREKLQALRDEYEKLKTSSDPIYAGEFDELIYTYLTELRNDFTGKPLREMSHDELQEMYEILRAIDDTLRDARKLIGWGDAEGVYEAGDAIAAEQMAITKSRKGGKRSAAQQVRDKMLFQSLSPVRNVERMSGYHDDSCLLKLFKKFEQGIRKKNRFMMEAYKSFEHLTGGKAYETAMYTEVGGKQYEDINGRKFGVSKMQMMQAILSYERETANGMHHIENGGFTFADLDMLRKGRLRDAISEEYSHRVPFAVSMIAEFTKALENDKWCQDYMAAARKFFNGAARDAINETSVALKHRIIAKDKSYIPFEVDRNFIVQEISAEHDIQQTINAYGMLKDTKDHAPQALIITGLNNVLDRHIEQVGNVYGLAVEVRNFNKVWNVKTTDGTGSDPTVKAAIQRNWGVDGVSLIYQAVQDIQGPRHSKQSRLYKKVKSGYIGATFLLNLSVVTKQIGSMYSSTSMLKWRGPVRQMGNLIYTMVNHKAIAAEVDKYTASAWMRRQGLSDAEVHTFMTEGKKSLIGGLASKLPTAINPGKWITGMDHAVALSLWRYAKQDTAKRTGLTGEELLKATAEFYDEVIENTQSMNDVLHRPELQKSDNILAESFAMFKTDLFQMAGQLEVTAGRFKANKTKENGKALGRTVYAIAMSAMWAQLMTTLFALLRYKVNHYRDEDDEELTAESWLKRQGFALAGDLMGYIFPIFGSETVGFFENIMYGESDDIVDSIALTAINDLYDTMTTVATAVKDGEMPEPAQMRKLVVKSLQVLGVPASNIIRTYEAIQLHAKDIANGEFFSFEANVDRSPSQHVHRITEALGEGRTDVAVGLYEEALEETAKSEDRLDEAKSSLKTALGDKYKGGEISKELTVDALTKCFGYSKEEAQKVVGEWDFKVDYGFAWGDRKDAYMAGAISEPKMKALLMSVGGKTAEEADEQIDKWDYEADNPELLDRITYTQYKRWEADGKPNGVSVELFTDVTEYRDLGSTTRSQDEVAAYINSLPISISQKDALWCCFWKKSTLYDKAPWH